MSDSRREFMAKVTLIAKKYDEMESLKRRLDELKGESDVRGLLEFTFGKTLTEEQFLLMPQPGGANVELRNDPEAGMWFIRCADIDDVVASIAVRYRHSQWNSPLVDAADAMSYTAFGPWFCKEISRRMSLDLSAIDLGVPLVAAIPFKGQESTWPRNTQMQYEELVAEADQVVYVTKGSYSPQAMHLRNAWMVDNSELVLALYGGDTRGGTKGGTAACVADALRKGRQIINVWPSFDAWRDELDS